MKKSGKPNVRWSEQDMVSALAKRYPSPEWAFFAQVRNGTGLQGTHRTADTLGCDQEVWVKDRILTAISAAILVGRAMRVRSDEDIVDGAMEGIANGAAVEIIRTLDMEPGFVNLRRVPSGAFRGNNSRHPFDLI